MAQVSKTLSPLCWVQVHLYAGMDGEPRTDSLTKLNKTLSTSLFLILQQTLINVSNFKGINQLLRIKFREIFISLLKLQGHSY